MRTLMVIVIIILALALFFPGCESSDSKREIQGYKAMDYKPKDLAPNLCFTVRVIVVDDCEYIVTGSGSAIVHKANCKNSIHDNRQEK